jgi:energy-converting hydrogenase Eha subunit C
MAQNFQFVPIYLNNKKVAELEEIKCKFMTNSEQQTGTDAVLGESTGIVMMEGSFNTVIPVAGMQIQIVGILLSQAYVDIQLEIGGVVYKVEGKLIDGEVTSTSKTGVTKGSFNFRGGAPQEITV